MCAADIYPLGWFSGKNQNVGSVKIKRVDSSCLLKAFTADLQASKHTWHFQGIRFIHMRHALFTSLRKLQMLSSCGVFHHTALQTFLEKQKTLWEIAALSWRCLVSSSLFYRMKSSLLHWGKDVLCGGLAVSESKYFTYIQGPGSVKQHNTVQ